MNSGQFERWLRSQGIKVHPKNSSGHVDLENPSNGKWSQMPRHGGAKQLGTGLIAKITTLRPHQPCQEDKCMAAYPIELSPDDNDTFLVTCPDIPELTTFGETRESAIENARDALIGIAAQYLKRGIDLPAPGAARGRPTIRLPALASAKLALGRAMRQAGVNQVALAARLDVDGRQVRRLLDLTVSSRFDEIERALAALGMDMDVRVAPRAA